MIHKSSFRSCTRFQAQTTPNCTSQEVGTSTADLVQKAYFTRGLALFRKAEYQLDWAVWSARDWPSH